MIGERGGTPPSSVQGGAAVATTADFAPERIYVLGKPANLRQGEEQTFVRIYNPPTENWTFGDDVPTRRYHFGVAVVEDRIYAIGGYTYHWILGDYEPVAVNERYTPLGYGTVPPKISIVSPENRTYPQNLSLNFTVNKQVNWVGYSLDGKENVTLHGNTALIGLSPGSHRLTLYADDPLNNTGISDPVYFTVDTTPPLSTCYLLRIRPIPAIM